MKTPIYISLILVILLFSCTKIGKNITVKGKVVNPITGEPFSEVKVQLLVSESLQLPGGKKEIKSAYTDSEGKFELSAGRTKTVYVQVQIPSNTYALGWYENGEHTSTSVKEVDKGKVMNVEYHLVPYGEVIFDIQNVNCQDATDTMWLQHRSEFENSYPEWWSLPRTGCYSYVSPEPSDELYIGKRFFRLRIKRGGAETFEEYEYEILEDQVTIVTLHY